MRPLNALGSTGVWSWLARRVPWGAPAGRICLERFRPSPFVLDLDEPAALPRRRYCFRTPATCGFYDSILEGTFALFRFCGALHFRANDRVLCIDDDVSCEWSEPSGESGRFILRHDAETWLQCDYQIPVHPLDRADLGFEISRNDFLRWVHFALEKNRRAAAFAGAPGKP